jgi:SgrR family transcriptional regulator
LDRLANDYLLLLQAFPEKKEREPVPVTMAELSKVLFCTPRNVKIILTKMVRKGWITFVPGRGRGHVSELAFLIHKEKFLGQQAEELVKSGHVEQAFQLIKEFGEGTLAKEKFFQWLSGYFGYEVVAKKEQSIEILRLPVYRPINTLDPAHSVYAFDLHMITQIFDTLVTYDYETNQITPGIAHHWKSNKEATSWIFYLRKGILFHHGRELVADDVAFSLNRLKRADSPQKWLVDQIEEITVLSRYSLKITLLKANHMFLSFLSYPPTSIVPRDVYEQAEAGSPILPVGSGPYKATKNTPGICVLEAFDHYF